LGSQAASAAHASDRPLHASTTATWRALAGERTRQSGPARAKVNHTAIAARRAGLARPLTLVPIPLVIGSGARLN
jgi:hypothetical protein